MSNDHPLVSIVTPSLNQGQFIEEMVLSIKNQEYPNIEHIIIDGGSTDNTLEILKKHEGTYNMRWISEPDGGMYEAVNKGLRRAKGEIVAYLNCDDLYFPWSVRVAVEYFMAHHDADIVYGDVILWDCENQSITLYFRVPFRLGIYRRRRGLIPQATVFLRKKVLERVGLFDEQLKFIGDLEYWMRASKVCYIRKIDEFLAVDRYHRNRLQVRRREELLQEAHFVELRWEKESAIKVKGMPDKCYMVWHSRVCYLRFFLWWSLTHTGVKVRKTRIPWRCFLTAQYVEAISWKGILADLLGLRCNHSPAVRVKLRELINR